MAAQHNQFTLEYMKLIGEYSKEFQKLAQLVADRAFELIEGGMGVSEAIVKALAENNFFGRNQDVLTNVLFRAAAYGYGIDPSKVANPAEVKRKLLYEAWAPDKMNLSERLHGSSARLRQEIVDTISSSMRQQKDVKGIAMDLYDGYNSGKKVIQQAELVDYLDQLQKSARRLMHGDTDALREFNQTLKIAQKNIDQLAAHDAPTGSLKAAYQKVVDAANDLSEKALNNAVHVAVEEKSRYLAERIARTEMSAAWGESFIARYQDNTDVIAYRWRLSSRHPRTDICDFYMHTDLYGLGPGVYPKDKLPRHPAHAHCMCLLEPVFEGEIHMDFAKESKILDSAALNKAAGDEYLKTLSDFDQKQLLGADGWKEWKDGKGWQQSLRNWEQPAKPETRFVAQDFYGGLSPSDQVLANNKASVIIRESGANSGALQRDSDKALEHAFRYYESVRHMKTDSASISRNTGIKEEFIDKIKEHIFINKHDLGGPEPERFFPDYEMAQSWQRLINGENIKERDITLLNHEWMERFFMEQGYSQIKAHQEANKLYNYQKMVMGDDD
ncbi:MAG: hypothetical protein E6713_06205 [Sporomusaceae bacterium]|nr:hypothetical protein [Sporomusaceae bacterium]